MPNIKCNPFTLANVEGYFEEACGAMGVCVPDTLEWACALFNGTVAILMEAMPLGVLTDQNDLDTIQGLVAEMSALTALAEILGDNISDDEHRRLIGEANKEVHKILDGPLKKATEEAISKYMEMQQGAGAND